MKKILFVSSRNPFSNIYSGDRIRAKAIITHLSKKNKVDLVCSDYIQNLKSKKVNFKGNFFFFKYNRFFQAINSIKALIKFKPMQSGFFFSSEIKNFVEENHSKYDTIIFHLLRCAEYLPKNFKGKKIMEMTDVSSNNYNQTIKKLSIFNPLFYLYFLELVLIKKFENYYSKVFDQTIIVSKKDLVSNKDLIRKKTLVIPLGCEINKRIFSFKEKNYKILFIGNINYLPNKYACYDFIKNILPKILKIDNRIEFNIVGEINRKDKILLSKYKNVTIHGPLKNLNKIVKKSICGIANLEIATGFQFKILTYMSYGLPVISSYNSFSGASNLIKDKDILVYQKNNKLIEYIGHLKINKKLSTNLSNNGFNKIKNKYSWKEIFKPYERLI